MSGQVNGNLQALVKHRDAILLAEIGALIHDLGKLSEEFVLSKCVEENSGEWIHHTAIVEYDVYKGISHAQKVKQILECIEISLDRSTIRLYDFVLGHHKKLWKEHKKWSKPESFRHNYQNYNYNENNMFLKLIIASDTFDSEEDKSNSKDVQRCSYGVCKSTSFGFENELVELDSLIEERKKVYRTIINWLGTCNFDEIFRKRQECMNEIRESFLKTLGETRRSANDVALWDHSYMTATIMKALVAYHVLNPNFVVKSKQDIIKERPFQIFAVGWDFFGFIEQSHKIPDVIGRVEIIDEVKRGIKSIVEEDYVLGNSVYEDEFGIYFLIPSIINEDDLREVKEKIFNVFNDKIKGIILPVFHIEVPERNGEFKIGKLLTKAINKIAEMISSHKVELIATPAWVEDWNKNTESQEKQEKRLVCNVCGKGFYCKGDDEKICETCKDIRKKGRKKTERQTVFIDEIAWNREKGRYENLCLLVAKFDLSKWLDGSYVRSLFVRAPDTEKILWLKDFYNSDIVGKNTVVLNENVIKKRLLSLGALNYYLGSRSDEAKNKAKNQAIAQIESCIDEYNNLDEFSKKLLIRVKENLEKAKKLIADGKILELQKVFAELSPNKVISQLKDEIEMIENTVLTSDVRYKQYERQIIKDSKTLEEILHKLCQKPSSPSRLMRIWRDTTNFFTTIAENIENIIQEVLEVEACIIKTKNFALKSKKLVENMPYIVEIPNFGVAGEIVWEENCETPIFRVITPHLSRYLLSNKDRVLGEGIKIFHPERKELVGVALIGDVIPVEDSKAYRVITISPTLFMAILPARTSYELLKKIKQEYETQFGKVFGKLPLHVGLIYFKRKMPMFAVLNSANRMMKFEVEGSSGIKFVVTSDPVYENDCIYLEVRSVDREHRSSSYKIRVPYKLGDGDIDYYHPYLAVEDSSEDVVEIKIGENNTIVQKHICRTKQDDVIKSEIYFLDLLFLDSNVRRFDIGKKRKHWLFTKSTNKPKPYLLWDIDNFERLRELVMDKLRLTTTQVMNLYEMLIEKIEDWNLMDVDKLRNDGTFEMLVKNAIKSVPLRLKVVKDGESGNGKISKKDYEFLKESILNGMFFDFVDLWHTILKEKFEGRGEKK